MNKEHDARTIPFEESGCEPAQCFRNVYQLVDDQGGELVTGWYVHDECDGLIRGYYHHAAWRKPSGELVEVTPRRCGDGTIERGPTVFIPDPDATLIPKGQRLTLRPVRYVPLVEHPLVHRLADLAARVNAAEYQGDCDRVRYYSEQAQATVDEYRRPRPRLMDIIATTEREARSQRAKAAHQRRKQGGKLKAKK